MLTALNDSREFIMIIVITGIILLTGVVFLSSSPGDAHLFSLE